MNLINPSASVVSGSWRVRFADEVNAILDQSEEALDLVWEFCETFLDLLEDKAFYIDDLHAFRITVFFFTDTYVSYIVLIYAPTPPPLVATLWWHSGS